MSLLESSEINIINNNISDNEQFGVTLERCEIVKISGNLITNNEVGIDLDSDNSVISRNTISNTKEVGISISRSKSTIICKNNFLNNNKNGFFFFSKVIWYKNYWERPRLLPYLIFGQITFLNNNIYWFNIDWRPALKPYDIYEGGIR
jgi:parallel beta-helix repeat protein